MYSKKRKAIFACVKNNERWNWTRGQQQGLLVIKNKKIKLTKYSQQHQAHTENFMVWISTLKLLFTLKRKLIKGSITPQKITEI